MGDSLTYGFYPYFLKSRLKTHKGRIKVINLGIQGFNSGMYLNYLKKNLSLITSHNENISLLMLGTNDIRLGLKYTLCRKYKKNMESIIKMLLDRNFKIILSLVPPVTRTVFPYYLKSCIKRLDLCINQIIPYLSDEYVLPLADNYKSMIGQNFPDGIHPDLKGYKQMADTWYQELKKII